MGMVMNPAPGVGTSVDASELGEEVVETAHLKNLAVTAGKLAAEAATAAKVKSTEVVTHAAASNKLTGKLGINNVTPPTQATDMGASNAGISITLLTEVAALINEDRGKLNEVRTCLRNHGLMA